MDSISLAHFTIETKGFLADDNEPCVGPNLADFPSRVAVDFDGHQLWIRIQPREGRYEKDGTRLLRHS